MKNPESDKKTALVQNKYSDSQQNTFKTQIFYHAKLRTRIKSRDSAQSLTASRGVPETYSHGTP